MWGYSQDHPQAPPGRIYGRSPSWPGGNAKRCHAGTRERASAPGWVHDAEPLLRGRRPRQEGYSSYLAEAPQGRFKEPPAAAQAWAKPMREAPTRGRDANHLLNPVLDLPWPWLWEN